MAEPFLSRSACIVIASLSSVSGALCAGWFGRWIGRLREWCEAVLVV